MNLKLPTTLLSFFMISTLYSQEIKLFPDNYLTDKLSVAENSDSSGSKSCGKSVNRVTNVSEPTIKIYRCSDSGPSTKTMIVSPGGAYNLVSYDLEGSEICEMLNENGFDAVLLKYRVPRREGRAKHEAPLQDVQRAISLVRANGSEYGICSDKVGVMGFSAGGHLSVMAATTKTKSYDYIDSADKFSSEVDFCALIYPAYLSADNFSLAPEIDVNNVSCPTFIAQAQNDKYYIDSSLFYYYALKQASKPATMYLFPEGGHGYGIRSDKFGANSWHTKMVEWLKSL